MNISLALGGGGAKGNSHIGVIRRLQQERFNIKAVAGTSFGGIVAVFFALGYTPDQIEDLFSALDQKRMYGHSPNEGPSLIGLAGAAKWFHEVIRERTFADLMIPCILTAADLREGREIQLSSGSLVDALLSTIAIPGLFPPHHIGDLELVDGGTLDPVPVAPARSLAPQLPVVAVVLSTPIGVPSRPWNIPVPEYIPQALINRLSKMRYTQAVSVYIRSMDIVTRAVTDYRLQVDQPDVILRPQVADIDILEHVDVHEVVRRGEQAVDTALPELKKMFAWQNRLRRTLGI